MNKIDIMSYKNCKIEVLVKDIGNGIIVKKQNAINSDNFLLGFDINCPEKRFFINILDGNVSVANTNETVFLARILFHSKSHSFIAKYDNIPNIGDTIVSMKGELFTLINNPNSIYLFSAKDNNGNIIDILSDKLDYYLIRKNNDIFLM